MQFRSSIFALLFTATCALLGGRASAQGWCDEGPAAEFATLEKTRVNSDWFVVYRIRPGVYALTEPRQAEQAISYLILGTRRAVLFDSGLGIGDIRAVVQELTPLPVTIVNSHTHFDHVGGNAAFDNILNENTPFTRRSSRGQASEPLAEYARSTLGTDHLCGSLPVTARVPYATRPWRITHFLHDRERLDLGDRVLIVIFTPGHTPDSMCLLDERNGLLFTGDTFYPGAIYLWAPETDLAAYRHSVAALAALVPHLSLLLPAHDIPSASPQALLELNAALPQVLAGALVPVAAEQGRRLYRFEHFSLLLGPSAK